MNKNNNVVKSYGNTFQLNELTFLPKEYQQVFSNKGNLRTFLEEAKEKNWAIDRGELMHRFNLNKSQVDDVVNSVYF